jgi:hypothetical protein
LGWNLFVHRDVRTIGAARVPLQQVGGAGDQVLRRQGRCQVFAADDAAWALFKMQGVTPIDQHENRLEQMVAIGAAASDVQKQIQLGRGWNVVKRFHGGIINKRVAVSG